MNQGYFQNRKRSIILEFWTSSCQQNMPKTWTLISYGLESDTVLDPSGSVLHKSVVSLDAECAVAHPVVVVGSSRRLQIRGGHHGARLVNVELRLVPVLLEAQIFELVEVCVLSFIQRELTQCRNKMLFH